MKNEISSKRPEFIKRQATKLKKELSIPHHMALDKAAVAAGYSNWAHCVNSSSDAVAIPVSPVPQSRRNNGPIPIGTLVRLKPRGSVGMVYKSNGSTVEFYDEWGPMLAAHEEVAICRNQSAASDFKPLRLFLPYGKWTCEDGSQVLFNRDYCPLWKRTPDGEVSAITPSTWIEHEDEKEVWFYNEASKPVDSKKTLTACLNVLKEWGVENRRSKLLELLPAGIRSGNMNLLKGYFYNRDAAA